MRPLKIEIEQLGRKTMTGSAILGLYPNKTTPILDLFVRECLQNSLDASNGSPFVRVDFNSGNFDKQRLCNSLEGVKASKLARFSENECKYLSVRDRYTLGLTGELSIDTVQRYEYGNLIKLVYDICKPQEIAGAGGSWGQGKTIYFRMGIGMVFYYSRVYNKEDNTYQSRLAGILVENEKSANGLIPQPENSLKSGVAWWGKQGPLTHTIPVTDEDKIKEFLEIFNITPFGEQETGTEIIIPFIDEQKLLRNNRSQEPDEDNFRALAHLPWTGDLGYYLSLSVQKWYFPRLNNEFYKYGAYLQVYINSKQLRYEDMLPLFRWGQYLYGKAAMQEKNTLDGVPLEVQVDDIRINSYLPQNCPSAGTLASMILEKPHLGMCPPSNYLSPYKYLDLPDDDTEDSNCPIFCFCRKPGMIVSYMDHDGQWIKGVPNSSPDTYILSIFVLNSENKLRNEDLSLEEYVRQSEMANHESWADHGENRTIIKNIKNNTAKALRKHYETKDDGSTKNKQNSSLGQFMANLLLPRTGFGINSSHKRKSAPRSTQTKLSTHHNLSYGLNPKSIHFHQNSLTFTYEVKALKSVVDSFRLIAEIASENGSIDAQQWEDGGLVLPFEIKSANINVTGSSSLDFNGNKETGGNEIFSCHWLKTEKYKIYGLEVQFPTSKTFSAEVTFTIDIKSKDLQPIIKVE